MRLVSPTTILCSLSTITLVVLLAVSLERMIRSYPREKRLFQTNNVKGLGVELRFKFLVEGWCCVQLLGGTCSSSLETSLSVYNLTSSVGTYGEGPFSRAFGIEGVGALLDSVGLPFIP